MKIYISKMELECKFRDFLFINFKSSKTKNFVFDDFNIIFEF